MVGLLTRLQAAEYLQFRGIKSSRTTLARLAMDGSGPKYTLIGGAAYYDLDWLNEWFEAQIKPHSHSLAHMMDKSGGSDV